MQTKNLIRTKRKAMGITQKELAVLLGKERSTIAKYEAGASLTLPVVKALSAILKIPIAEFLDNV